MMKLLILIPSYNTHIYKNKLLSILRKHTQEKILIYDDGSSPALNNDLEQYSNIIYIRNESNKGKGYVIKKGFEYAISNNYNYVVTIDGDLQHNPNEINKFILCDSNIDFVLGCRKFLFPMPMHRRISNTITSFVISLLVSKSIKDSQCGYRRYALNSITLNDLNEDGFLLESEILLKCLGNKSIIKNIGVQTIYSNSKSHINNIYDTFRFIKLIIRHIIG